MSPIIDRMLDPSMSIRFKFLFAALLLTLAAPVLLPDRAVEYVVPPLFTVLTLTALVTVAEKRATLIVGLLLAAPALISHWLPPIGQPSLTGEISGDLFLIWVTWAILARILRAERVTTEVLFAVASVYLLLALIWALGYGIADMLQPGTLWYPEALLGPGEDPSVRGIYSYFSFVTLTTLGYGDISPVTDVGRMLAMLEATLGQLFLVIVVARLVGMHTAQGMAQTAKTLQRQAER
jgi:hypothetical protein